MRTGFEKEKELKGMGFIRNGPKFLLKEKEKERPKKKFKRKRNGLKKCLKGKCKNIEHMFFFTLFFSILSYFPIVDPSSGWGHAGIIGSF